MPDAITAGIDPPGAIERLHALCSLHWDGGVRFGGHRSIRVDAGTDLRDRRKLGCARVGVAHRGMKRPLFGSTFNPVE
jgi:hypothetical protein